MSLSSVVGIINGFHRHERNRTRGSGVDVWIEKAEVKAMNNVAAIATKKSPDVVSMSLPYNTPLRIEPATQAMPKSSAYGEKPHYDFIIKSPDPTIEICKLRSMPPQEAHRTVAQTINGFLQTVWKRLSTLAENSSRCSGSNTDIVETSSCSPLMYREHKLQEDGSIAVALALCDQTGDFTKEAARLCDYLHSPDCARNRVCGRLSQWDIFGLKPIERTPFSVCWDSGFLYNMLRNGETTVRSARSWIKDAGQKLGYLDIDWLRIGGFLLKYYIQRKEHMSKYDPKGNDEGLLPHIEEIMDVPIEDVKKKLETLFKTFGELFTDMVDYIRTPTVAEWKGDIQGAKDDLDRVSEEMGRLLEALNVAPLQAELNEDMMERTNELYYSYRDALNSMSRAVLSNTKMWRAFQITTGVSCTASAASAYMLYNSTSSLGAAIKTLSLATGGPELIVGWTLGTIVSGVTTYEWMKSAWGAGKKYSWCKQIDSCFSICDKAVSKSQGLTGYMYLFHSRGQEHNLLRQEISSSMEDFIHETRKITGQDPREKNFIKNGGYNLYIEKQKEMLDQALKEYGEAFRSAQKCED